MKFRCQFAFVCNRYQCRVEAVNSEELRGKDLFKGDHMPGKSDLNVTTVVISGLPIDGFPKKIGFIFPNIRELLIEDCGIKNISRQDLEGLEKLRFLSLKKNELTVIPNDLFTGFESLDTLVLSFNKIDTASSKFLQPIINTIDFVDLACNLAIDTVFYLGNRSYTMKHFMAEIDENCRPYFYYQKKPRHSFKPVLQTIVKKKQINIALKGLRKFSNKKVTAFVLREKILGLI